MRNDDRLIFRDDDLVTLRPAAAPRFPLGATLAGLIWLLVGGLGVATATLSLGSAKPSAGNALTGLVFAAWMTAAGYKTMAGQARDTRIHGTLSLLAGLAMLGLGAIIYTSPLKGETLPRSYQLVVVSFYAGFGLVGFALPGVLALAARRDYLAWREANTGTANPSGRRKPGALGECRACGYSPVAGGARACPRCGADAPNPNGRVGRFAGRGMLIGMAAGAVVGWTAKLVASGNLNDAAARAILAMIPGLVVGLVAGLVLGAVWRPSR